MEYEKIKNLIEEYKTEGNFSVTEIFDALNKQALIVTRDEQKELLNFIKHEINDWNDYSDSEKEYDNKFHYAITTSNSAKSVNIFSGIGKLTITSEFLIYTVK